MSNLDFPFEDNLTTKEVVAVKHCRSCWRNESHRQVPISPFLLGFLMVLTLGLVFVLRPYRCTCCGRSKFV